MSRDELRLFSYEILGLVGSTGAGTHDLRRMVERGGMLDWAGESQYYVEPKRLAKLGYLDGAQGAGQDARPHRLHAHGQGPRGAARVGATRPSASRRSRASS